MSRACKEFSLDELLEQPALSIEIRNKGIEQRSIGLLLELASVHHRFAEAEWAEGLRSSSMLA